MDKHTVTGERIAPEKKKEQEEEVEWRKQREQVEILIYDMLPNKRECARVCGAPV